MLGADFLASMDARLGSTAFGTDSTRMSVANAFGEIWLRPGMERRIRSLITIAMLIPVRAAAEIKNHTRAALANGCTVQELEELALHAIPYCGFPAASHAQQAIVEVLQERGLLEQDQSMKERGLL